MSTVTARSIRRANPKGKAMPTLARFCDFLAKQGTTYRLSGRPLGHRVFVGAARMGRNILVATFRHPTKPPTEGRYATVTWQLKETK